MRVGGGAIRPSKRENGKAFGGRYLEYKKKVRLWLWRTVASTTPNLSIRSALPNLAPNLVTIISYTGPRKRTSAARVLKRSHSETPSLLISNTRKVGLSNRRRMITGGKCFTIHSSEGWLENKLTPFAIKALRGKLYIGSSWKDQNECIVLDYSKTSILAHWVRDELRLIEPPLHLGKVYLGHAPLFHFALRFGR